MGDIIVQNWLRYRHPVTFDSTSHFIFPSRLSDPVSFYSNNFNGWRFMRAITNFMLIETTIQSFESSKNTFSYCVFFFSFLKIYSSLESRTSVLILEKKRRFVWNKIVISSRRNSSWSSMKHHSQLATLLLQRKCLKSNNVCVEFWSRKTERHLHQLHVQ